MKKSLLILPLAFVLALAGCNDGGGSSTSGGSGTSGTTSGTTSEPSKSSSSVIDPQIVTVSLDKDAITLDAFNSKSYHLNATVVTLGGAYDGVSFASDKPAVADVSPDGTVTAYSVGTAVITATSFFDATKKATCTVSVTDHHPALQHTVSINLGGEDIAMEPMRDIPEGEGGAYQFTKQINVVKNSPISFKLDGANCPAYKDSGVHNVIGDAPGAYKIHNDADSSIYFKAYVDEFDVYSYSFYISGYETPQGWFLKGSFNGWTDADQMEEHPEGKPADVDKQYRIEAALSAGDLLKFERSSDETWVGYSAIEEGNYKSAISSSDDNILVRSAGTYVFYVKEYTDSHISIYIEYPLFLTAVYHKSYVLKNAALDMNLLDVSYYNGSSEVDKKSEATYYVDSTLINPATYEYDTVEEGKVVTIKYEYESGHFVETSIRFNVIQKVLCAYVTGDGLENADNEAHPNYYMWVWNSTEAVGHLEQVAASEISYTEYGYKIKLAHPIANSIDRCIVFRCDPEAVYSDPTVYPSSGIWNTAYVDDDTSKHDMVVYENPEGHFYADAKFWN